MNHFHWTYALTMHNTWHSAMWSRYKHNKVITGRGGTRQCWDEHISKSLLIRRRNSWVFVFTGKFCIWFYWQKRLRIYIDLQGKSNALSTINCDDAVDWTTYLQSSVWGCGFTKILQIMLGTHGVQPYGAWCTKLRSLAKLILPTPSENLCYRQTPTLLKRMSIIGKNIRNKK